MARGIRCNHNGNQTTLACAFRIDSSMWPWQTQDFTICGWSSMKGVSPGLPGRGQCPFEVTTTNSDIFNLNSLNFFEWFCDTNHENPWDRLIANVSIGGFLDNFTPSPNVLINENWFYALTYNRLANQFHWYYAKDGAVALTARPTYSPVATFNPSAPAINVALIGWDGTPGAGANEEFTNYKVWNRFFSASELLAEMKSETPVIRTRLWAHWPLLNHTDTSDASGLGHTLTMQGTVTDGVMNPADIRDARITADVLERLALRAPEVRVTSDMIERLDQDTATELRMSSDLIEYLMNPTVVLQSELRLSQDVIEYLFKRPAGGISVPTSLKCGRATSYVPGPRHVEGAQV